MKVVFDINIYIATLYRSGLCADILHTILHTKDIQIDLYATSEILSELEGKLQVMVKKNLIPAVAVKQTLETIYKYVHVAKVRERISGVVRDPDDHKILECALAAEAHVIVTMDKDLLSLKQFRYVAIIHPSTFRYMLPNF